MVRLNKIGASLAAPALSLGLVRPTSVQMPTWLDFAHPEAPHLDSAMTSPDVRLVIPSLMVDGDVVRQLPVLVVLLEFDDLAAQAGDTAAHYAEIVFQTNRPGGLPSVADVYRRLSNGRLQIVPAVAGDADGAADGVVGWVTAQYQAGCCRDVSLPPPDTQVHQDQATCQANGNTWTTGTAAYYG